MNKNIKLIKDIQDNYEKHDAKYFASKHKVSISRIYALASELKVSSAYLWGKYGHNIIEDYNKGINLLDLSQKYGHSPTNIKKFLIKNNIKIRENGEWQTFYTWDKSFFKKIDSYEKAYWLGFIYADGNVRRKEYGQGLFQIALARKDRNHLVKLKKSLKSNHPIYKDGANNRIIISQQEIFDDLMNLGVSERKSLTLLPPTNKQVPKEFLSSFILGYFDGDGCIYINKKRWCFSILGTKEICGFIQKIFYEYKINTYLYKEKRTKKNVWVLQTGGTNKELLKRVFNFLYFNNPIYLYRKYKKFLHFLEYE